MNKIFRFVGIGTVLAAMFALGAAATFAQDPCADVDAQNAKYQDVLKNYKTTDPDTLQKAVDAGKEFLEKYGACEAAKPQVDWMKPKVPIWEGNVPILRDGIAKGKRYERFDASFKAQNWDDVFAAGKEILAKEPDKVDVMIVLASIGFDQAAKKNTKYNDDSLNYAKQALQKISAGAPSEKYGLFGYVYNTKDNAIGWMNFIAGYILYNGKDDKKGALPYLYQATLNGPETPKNPAVYETIGRYFLAETVKLSADVKAKVEDQKVDDTPEVAAQKVAAIKAAVALVNGNAERAMDAYARAYKVAKTDAATKPYRDSLSTKIKDLYLARHPETKDVKVDDFVASATAKPFEDPTSPVTPIADPEPVKTTTTSTVPASTSMPTKPAGAKPGGSSSVTAPVAAKKGVR
ncbi:MAG: hypothetical protein ABI878_13175 [Acidobacteriota bacterium]